MGTVFFITDFIFFSTPTIHVSNCLPVRVGYTKSVERDHQSGLRAYLPDSFLTSSSVLPWRLCAEANCQQLLVCDSTKCMEPSHKILPSLSNRMVYPYQCKIKASCCSLTPRACSGSGESRAISLSTLIGKRTQIPDVARAVYDKGTGTSG